MANHKSALKRARQNEGRRLRNKSRKTRVKSAVKEVRGAVSAATKEDAAARLDTAKSIIAKAAKSGTLHKKTASRRISRLTKLVNKLDA